MLFFLWFTGSVFFKNIKIDFVTVFGSRVCKYKKNHIPNYCEKFHSHPLIR